MPNIADVASHPVIACDVGIISQTTAYDDLHVSCTGTCCWPAHVLIIWQKWTKIAKRSEPCNIYEQSYHSSKKCPWPGDLHVRHVDFSVSLFFYIRCSTNWNKLVWIFLGCNLNSMQEQIIDNKAKGGGPDTMNNSQE